MSQSRRILDPTPIVLLILLCLLTGAAAFFSRPMLWICAGAAAAAAVLTAVSLALQRKRARRFLGGLSRELSQESEVLSSLPIPVLVARESGEILWYNDAMRSRLPDPDGFVGRSVGLILSEETAEQLAQTGSAELTYHTRAFQVFLSYGTVGAGRCAVYYFCDQTRLRKTAAEYQQSRPTVALVSVDNLDELFRNARDSETAAIRGAIEKEIENWAAGTNGIFCKLSSDRFLLVTEERALKLLIDNRFDVLDKVRALRFGERGNATLSIGVGRGGTLAECEETARQALDMALGRGGDQAVVKNRGNFEFFGGVSSTGPRRSRVRTRVVASALRELIESSDFVLVTGHRFADLDCFGAAYATALAARRLGRPAHVVLTREKALCGHLIARAEECEEARGLILSPARARELITRKTLLIVVDTHRSAFLDAPELYDAAQTVAVIDHHRKTVDYIDKAVLFYHDPYASSASEMVTELMGYLDVGRMSKTEAEALLSGIMLDTRNFVLHTGVRTFEASAYLRGCGADPVAVKRLFAGSMALYQERAAIVSSAELYGDCAVSETPSTEPDVRIAASQAADEMLSLERVNASFVLFEADGAVNISARSLGAVNVQVIMETLGGGGHLTMAAAQLPGRDLASARRDLIAAIDAYRQSASH